MSELKLVIFDMDGTLMDSQAFILMAMERAFETAGHALPSQDEVMATIGLSLGQVVARLLPGLDADETRQMARHYEQTFLDLRAELGGEVKTPLYPGARAELERLHRVDEVLMGVATGKSRQGLDHAYAAHDLGHFFLTSQTADNHQSKPHPSMLLQALSETGAEAAGAVMIGDTEFDMEMGRAAGFATIGVSWGYHPVSRLGAADIIIDDFAELFGALREIWRG